jgi:putative NADPH-quinone reductase
MRIMAIIDHPWSGSFNHAVLERAVGTLESGGHEVDVLDLHRAGFDPVLREEELSVYTRGEFRDPKVREYQQRIERARHLVFVFPVWWEVMPALLKGFFDKVFLPGWAFREEDAAPLLGHIEGATVITTMGAPSSPHTSVDPVLCRGILEFCGVPSYRWINIRDVGNCAPEKRSAFLDEVEEHLSGLV